jgi:phosphatidylglycerol---prolipoprotein diacylglyceryl transferase
MTLRFCYNKLMFHFTPIPQINLGFWQISTHGLVIAAGFLIALFFAAREAKRRGLDPAPLESAAAVGVIAGLIGARIVYIIFWGGGMSIWDMLRIWEGGLSSHGGYLVGFIAAFVYLKIKKNNALAYFDAAGSFILLGWAIGRIGCFLNWDSYGKISNSFFTIVVFGENRFPTQLFESFGYLLGFSVCTIVVSRFGAKLKKGGLFALSLALFALARFLVDFLRDDPFAYYVFSQFFTAVIFVVSGCFFVQSIKKPRVI